ncbi:hypothetical protein ACFS6H_08910 [Terrimonas rubra]|uniref:Bacteriocin-type signal sequence-containing protein n=1 Tax=Terrimonas rubra TaxID=1035890 RepID=A0ABW6A437_9BACT
MKKLSREELKNTSGGQRPGGGVPPVGTVCDHTRSLCYEAEGIKYYCHVEYVGPEYLEECCCGHYLGDGNCYAA